jgi:hypothetical protein
MTYQAINYMLGIRIVGRVDSLPADKVHDLVLSLTWDASIRNDNLQLQNKYVSHLRLFCTQAYVFPAWISILLLYDPIT